MAEAEKVETITLTGSTQDVVIQQVKDGWRVSINGKPYLKDKKPLTITEGTAISFEMADGQKASADLVIISNTLNKNPSMPILVNRTDDSLRIQGSAILEEGQFETHRSLERLTGLSGERKGKNRTATMLDPAKALAEVKNGISLNIKENPIPKLITRPTEEKTLVVKSNASLTIKDSSQVKAHREEAKIGKEIDEKKLREEKLISFSGKDDLATVRRNYQEQVIAPVIEKVENGGIKVNQNKGDAKSDKKSQTDKKSAETSEKPAGTPIEMLEAFEKEYKAFLDKKKPDSSKEFQHQKFRDDIAAAKAATKKMTDSGISEEGMKEAVKEFDQAMDTAILRAHFPNNIAEAYTEIKKKNPGYKYNEETPGKNSGEKFIAEMSGKIVGRDKGLLEPPSGLNKIKEATHKWIEEKRKEQAKTKEEQKENSKGGDTSMNAPESDNISMTPGTSGGYGQVAVQYAALAAAAAANLPKTVTELASQAVTAIKTPEFAEKFSATVTGLSQRADKAPPATQVADNGTPSLGRK